MTFDSFDFALFLPVAFLCYWMCAGRTRAQNAVLLAFSSVFYGWWDCRFLALIAFTTLVSYFCALRISASQTPRFRKGWNLLNIIVNLAILGYYKYCNFFADSLCEALNMAGIEAHWPLLHVVLPVGISFYTFQALSYTLDVYHGTVAAQRSLLVYASYISFFPQLVAGPIERAGDLLPQFHGGRTFDYALAADGARRMLWGFFKKIAVADSCAETVQLIFDQRADVDSLTLFYGAFLFSMQIYADFSGYSDIAIGCAQLFGIRLKDNFHCPYFSTSIPDFWRRWHISLTSWFRDYVYIPLGGSRCSRYRTLLNTLVVFSLSGLWHGASWHFVVWGAYHGCLFIPYILLGRGKHDGGDERLTGLVWLRMAITFVLVLVGWVIFRAQTFGEAWLYISRMCTAGIRDIPPFSKNMLVPIAFMLFMEWRSRSCRHALQNLYLSQHVRLVLYYLLLLMCLWYSGQSTQFIYFQF